MRSVVTDAWKQRGFLTSLQDSQLITPVRECWIILGGRANHNCARGSGCASRPADCRNSILFRVAERGGLSCCGGAHLWTESVGSEARIFAISRRQLNRLRLLSEARLPTDLCPSTKSVAQAGGFCEFKSLPRPRLPSTFVLCVVSPEARRVVFLRASHLAIVTVSPTVASAFGIGFATSSWSRWFHRARLIAFRPVRSAKFGRSVDVN